MMFPQTGVDPNKNLGKNTHLTKYKNSVHIISRARKITATSCDENCRILNPVKKKWGKIWD